MEIEHSVANFLHLIFEGKFYCTVEKSCPNEYILGIGLGEVTQCDKPAEPTGVSHTQTECKGTQLSVGSQTTKMLRQQAKTKKASGSEHQYFISRRSSKIISDADSGTDF